MSHTYNSPEYFAQAFKEFISGEQIKKKGYHFSNITHSRDYVSFDSVNKTFALEFKKNEGEDKCR